MATPVAVIYGDKRKLVNIDKGSLDNTRGEIKRKFSQLGNGFILQAKSEEEHFDIEDEDDFGDHSEAVVFIVRDANEIDEPVNNPRPQSTLRVHTDQSVTVMFRNKRKLVTFDMTSLQTTRRNIRMKFTDLEDDFQLLAEAGDARDQYDIDDDDDLKSHAGAPMFHIRVATCGRNDVARHSHTDTEPSQSEATVICGSECKLLRIDHANLQKTLDTIRARFKVVDFKLYAVSPDGIQYEIEQEQDWLKYGNFRTFILKSNHASLHPRQSMAFDTTSANLPPPYSVRVSHQRPSGEADSTAAATAVKSLVQRFNATLKAQAPQTTSSLNPRTESGSFLDNLPRSDTPMVKDAILDLRNDIDIPGIHRKMEVFGDCLRLALYGVAAAERNAKLEMQVQELQFNALRLCKESDLTIVHCKQVSDEILTLLASAFGYLSDGLFQVAQTKFERISVLSKEMETKSKLLKEKLVSSTGAVHGVIKATTNERDGASKAHELLKEKESKRKAARRTVNTFPGAKPSTFSKFISLFTVHKNTTEATEPDEAQIKERINRHIQEERYENDEMISMAERLKTEGDAGEMATTALHGTMTALKSLHSSFETAEKFWSNIHMLCERVAESQKYMHSTGQEQSIDYWKSKGFQVEATKTYASFMALRTLCQDFHAGMGVIEDNIQCCIQDNPTPEQARSNVKDMAATFQKKVEENMQRFNHQLTDFVEARRLDDTQQENQERVMEAPAEIPRTVEDVSPATTIFHQLSLQPR